jgi:hypothetical protein
VSGLRAWLVILAVTCFLAGLAGGILIGLELQPPPAERGPFADYEELLVERFDLSPRRAELLHKVMNEYHKRIENLKARYVDDLEPDLVRLGLTFRGHVRDDVLPASRRDEFDRLAAGAFLD